MTEVDAIVIGAGMVGAAAAFGLVRRGLKVTMLDGGDLDYRAARGNGGLVWVQGKGLEMTPYQILTRRSSNGWPEFARDLQEVAEANINYRRDGGLTLCLGNAEAAAREADLKQLHSLPGAAETDFEMLDRAEIEKLMPDAPFGPDVSGASFCPLDGHVDPLRLLMALQDGFRRQGGKLLSDTPVRAVVPEAGGFRVDTDTGAHRAPKVLIAAGNGSAPLARQVGLDVPVRPQRGQMMITERVAPTLPLPCGGVRQTVDGTFQIGATKEEVGFDISTTAAAASTMARRAVRILPMLADVKVVRQWSALRIMTPDGHPIYAESEEHPGAFVALCHSGITLAAAHCEFLSETIASGALPDWAKPFHHRRFDVSKAA